MPLASTWMPLVSWPPMSRTVRVAQDTSCARRARGRGSRSGCAPWKRQRHPPVAGAHVPGILKLDAERPLDGPGCTPAVRAMMNASASRRSSARRNFLRQVSRRRPVLHRDDRLVVDVDHQIVGHAGGARRLRQSPDSAIRQGRGRSRTCAWRRRKELRSLGAQPLEHLLDHRVPYASASFAKAFALDVRQAGLFEITELLEELLQPEGPLQRSEEVVDALARLAAALEFAAEQREARVDDASSLATRQAVA
jgi:hypothetical protein